MLIFKNGILEYVTLAQEERVMLESLVADGCCDCFADEAGENLQQRYFDGTEHTAVRSILINMDSVVSNFKPSFVRYKTERDSEFTQWMSVKSVKYYDITKSIHIVCL